MKKPYIFGSLCVIMLLVSFVPVNLGADVNTIFIDPPLKFPGELVPNAPVYNSPVFQKDEFHPAIEITEQDDLVVEMLLDLDETLFLIYLEDLVDFGPRRTGTQACWDAGDWIYDQFKSMGLQVRYQNWSSGGNAGHNIEGTLLGINESSDEIYIICAHYDSVTGSPGADDDGSGVAAVLVAAYLMSQYAVDHTVRFVAFDGEEQGLLGSYQYAQQAASNGDNIVGALNGDMIGYATSTYDGDTIKIYENPASHWLLTYSENIATVYDEYIDLNIINSGSSGGSDHYSFWQNGYDSIFYHEYHFNDFYHSPSDTIANMNISYAVKCSRLEVAALAELAGAVVPSEPPSQPTISGPDFGFIGDTVEFTVSSVDPEGEDVYYYIDWDDGYYTEWAGPYVSGAPVQLTHQWSGIGDYEILVQSRDVHKVKSEWSDPFSFSILRGPILDVKTIEGGLFRASTIIKNDGDYPATDVAWTISFDGGAFIGAETSGVIASIPAGGTAEIASGFVLGLGPTVVTATAEIDQGSSDFREQGGLILLFFVKINPGGG